MTECDEAGKLASYIVKQLAANPETIDKLNRCINWVVVKEDVSLGYDEPFSEDTFGDAMYLVEQALAEMQVETATIH